MGEPTDEMRTDNPYLCTSVCISGRFLKNKSFYSSSLPGAIIEPVASP